MPGLCDDPLANLACVGAPTPSGPMSGLLDDFTHWVWEGLGKAIGQTLTLWLNIPTPTYSTDSGPLGALLPHLSWLIGAMGVLGVVLGAGRFVIAQRGQGAHGEFGKGLVRFVVATSMLVPVVALLTQFGDAWSPWLIKQAADGDLGANATKMASIAAVTPLGMPAVLTAGVFALVGVLIQYVLMLVRVGALLVVLVGTQLAAGAAFTDTGKQTFNKLVSWLLALVLYKPVAAIVYAAAFVLLGHGSGTQTQITGLFMIAASFLVLPALMRLVTPAVSAVTSNVSPMGALAGGASAATGAVMMGGSMKSGGSSPGPGSSGAGLVGGAGPPGPAGTPGAGKPGPSSTGPTGGGAAPRSGSQPSPSGGQSGPAGLRSGGAATSGAAAAGGPAAAGAATATAGLSRATGAINNGATQAIEGRNQQ